MDYTDGGLSHLDCVVHFHSFRSFVPVVSAPDSCSDRHLAESLRQMARITAGRFSLQAPLCRGSKYKARNTRLEIHVNRVAIAPQSKLQLTVSASFDRKPWKYSIHVFVSWLQYHHPLPTVWVVMLLGKTWLIIDRRSLDSALPSRIHFDDYLCQRQLYVDFLMEDARAWVYYQYLLLIDLLVFQGTSLGSK